MDFAIIAAMDANRGIGKDNDLPWHLPADFKHFIKQTKGGTVIMGRKTWDSIPDKYRPLKGRYNIVVSRQEDYILPEGVDLVNSLDEAFEKAESKGQEPAFVIGGAQLYEEAIHHPKVNKLVLTEIQNAFDCDRFFPELPEGFKPQEKGDLQEEGHLSYRFVTYERSSSSSSGQ